MSRPSVENRRVSFLFGIAKSFSGLSSCLLFVRGATFPSSLSSFQKKKSSREQVELLLPVSPSLIFDDGIWVGRNKDTSTMAMRRDQMSRL